MPMFLSFAVFLLALLVAPAEATGLLGGLKKQITQSPIGTKTPDELAQALKEKAEQVAKTTPQDIADTIKDALNASAAKEDPTEELKDAAQKQAAGVIQTLKGGTGNKERPEAPVPPQEKLSKALTEAGQALHKGASAVAKANASDVEDLLKGVGQVELLDQAKVLKEQIKSGKITPEEVAARLRRASRSASLRFNATSMSFTDVLRTKIPQVAVMLDQAGTAVADQLSDGIEKVTGKKPSPQEVRGFGIMGSLVGFCSMCGIVAGLGCRLILLKTRREARGPGLLTDPVSSGGGTGGRVGIQMPATETTSFVNF